MRAFASRRSFALALPLLIAAPAGAQGTIRGVLFDSLRTVAPIEGAEVVLVGSARRATTDRHGRFVFALDDAAAGPYRIAYWAPWLDSVGVPALEREISAGGGEVMLVTPSMSTVQRALCGDVLEPGQGILFGELRAPDGAPLGDLPVWARWDETRLGVGQLDRREVATVDTSSASGFFALCGVPLDAEVALRADDGSRGTGDLVASLGDARIRRRDLIVAPASTRFRLTGRVRAPDASPVTDAVIVLLGDSLSQVSADSSGRFAFDAIPQRSTQLVVKAVGYRPATVDVEPLADPMLLSDVTLERVPYELSRVRVDGTVMTAEEFEFERRRRVNTGYFVDEVEISRYPTFTAAALHSLAPRTRLYCPSECTLMLTRAIEWCTPKLFVDGFMVDSGEQKPWLQRAKRVEVYRAAFAPPQFTDFEGCGALVIWTR